MDDLISRKAAIDAIRAWAEQPVIRKSRGFEPKGKAIVLDMIGVVTEQPSVPAVPLDKLCEWLADELHVSVDCGIDHCENCDAYDGTVSVKGCWMKLIKEQVMEEHNGTENP